MRNLLLFIALAGLVGCQPAEEPMEEESEAAAVEEAEEEASLNAVDVDADITTVELENEWVRVIRTKTPPAHVTNRHTHEGGVFVSLTGGTSKTTSDSGESTESESEVGDIGTTFERMGVPHVTENLSEHETESIMVELEIKDGTPLDPPSHDAVEVDAEHHTVEFENDLVRVVRMRYPEGYQTPPHNHYPGVNIVLSDVRATSAPEGEETEPAENAAGSVAWSDGFGEPHVTTNLGDEMHIVRVELKVQ